MPRIVKIAAVIVAAAVLSASAAASPIRQGKGLYGQYCLSCHGANGEGVHPASSRRGYGPSLRGVGALAADFYLRTGYMPLRRLGLQPRRTRVLFGEAQIRALVAYVASLKTGPSIPTPHPERGNLSEGLALFTDHCAGCHQVVAQGGVVSGALPPPLENATDVQIAEAVRIGPYVMPRFSKNAISDMELDSIVRYVDYTKHADNRGGWALGDIGPVPEGLVAWFIAAAVLVALCVIIGERIRRE
jgi:ubiquinol-cytochrome c reductase cytochrome c subunit